MRNESRRGLSLVEILLAVLLLCGGVFAALQVSISDSQVLDRSENRLVADLALQELRACTAHLRVRDMLTAGIGPIIDFQAPTPRLLTADPYLIMANKDLGVLSLSQRLIRDRMEEMELRHAIAFQPPTGPGQGGTLTLAVRYSPPAGLPIILESITFLR